MRVVLHTGHQHEEVATPASSCAPARGGRVTSPRRPALDGDRLALSHPNASPPTERGWPGRCCTSRESRPAAPLTLLTLASARLGGRRVVYSPHDTFSRRGRLDARLLRLALRVPHASIVHSEADVGVLRAAGLAAHYVTAGQLVPHPPRPSAGAGGRSGARATTEVVLFAGCIRPEKRLDLLIESARSWPRAPAGGRGRGPRRLGAMRRLARGRGWTWRPGWSSWGCEDFTAALAAADLVVAPHERASQSGVLSLAGQLGMPTVAAGVGGLGELASRTFSR